MLILDANRRNKPVPALARCCLVVGIAATICANLAYGLGYGPIGALVTAWPALALAGSFELLMILIRAERQEAAEFHPDAASTSTPTKATCSKAVALPLEQTGRAKHLAGHSQRAIARELDIDRRKVKLIIDETT